MSVLTLACTTISPRRVSTLELIQEKTSRNNPTTSGGSREKWRRKSIMHGIGIGLEDRCQ